MKFRRVKNTQIFISSMNEAKNSKLIKDNNIKAIFGIHDKNEIIRHNGVVNLNISMDDPLTGLAHNNMIFSAVEVFNTAYQIAIQLKGQVLVHCCAGNNRSALVVALWLEKHLGWELQKAINATYVKNNKPWMQHKGLHFIPRDYKGK